MIIVWRVLNDCNLACPFCAYDKRLDIRRRRADLAQVRRVMGVVTAWGRARGERILLSWLGGEPLLWRELESLTEAAARAGVGVSATTNGSSLGNARARRHILDHYEEITFSLDGFAAFHDSMRGRPGSYAQLEAGVRALAAERALSGAQLKIRINAVLMRDNIGDFADLCREVARWGADEVSFNQLGGRDRPEFWPTHRLRAEDVALLRAALPALRRELAGRLTIVGGEAYLRRIEETTRGVELPVAACQVARSFLFIDEDGRIAPCSFAPEHFGRHVDEIDGPQAFDAMIEWFSAEQQTRPARDCADCPSTQQFAKWE